MRMITKVRKTFQFPPPRKVTAEAAKKIVEESRRRRRDLEKLTRSMEAIEKQDLQVRAR